MNENIFISMKNHFECCACDVPCSPKRFLLRLWSSYTCSLTSTFPFILSLCFPPHLFFSSFNIIPCDSLNQRYKKTRWCLCVCVYCMCTCASECETRPQQTASADITYGQNHHRSHTHTSQSSWTPLHTWCWGSVCTTNTDGTLNPQDGPPTGGFPGCRSGPVGCDCGGCASERLDLNPQLLLLICLHCPT